MHLCSSPILACAVKTCCRKLKGGSLQCICLQHPEYGLVTLKNARDIMQRLDDPLSAPANDIDGTLNRLAQVKIFWAVNLVARKSLSEPTLFSDPSMSLASAERESSSRRMMSLALSSVTYSGCCKHATSRSAFHMPVAETA